MTRLHMTPFVSLSSTLAAVAFAASFHRNQDRSAGNRHTIVCFGVSLINVVKYKEGLRATHKTGNKITGRRCERGSESCQNLLNDQRHIICLLKCPEPCH